MKRGVFALLLVLLVPRPVHAAAPYFQFAPDYRQPFITATATSVGQVFLPLNDHISGFDMWLSDGGTPADVQFDVLSPSGSTLSTRAVTVGAIPDSDSGTVYHVNLPSQLAVAASGTYEIRVTSSAPTLRLYWAANNSLLPLNAPPPPLFSGGTARVDGTDTGNSFLYALYETSETTPPALSNVTVRQETPTRSVMSFNASEPTGAVRELHRPVAEPVHVMCSRAPELQRFAGRRTGDDLSVHAHGAR